jgi:hypothetical protein
MNFWAAIARIRVTGRTRQWSHSNIRQPLAGTFANVGIGPLE